METGIATGVGIVASAVVTLMGSYWLFVLQRRKERLAFEVLTREVVIPVEFEPGDSLQVLVRSDVLTEATTENEHPRSSEYIPAGKVYGFRVLLRNPGTDPIGDHTVYVELDETARIVSVEAERVPKGTKAEDVLVLRDPEHPNVGSCRFTFLNQHEEITVSIQSLQNETPHCEVYAREKGFVLQDLGERAARFELAGLAVGAFGLLTALSALAIGSAIYGPGSGAEEVLRHRPGGFIVYGLMLAGWIAVFAGFTPTLVRTRRLLRHVPWWREHPAD